MKNTVLILSLTFVSVACVPDKSEITVTMNKKNKSTLQQASVSSVQIINNQLVINGAGLSAVSNVKVNGNGLSENFAIASKNSGKIIANSIRAFSFDVSKVFNLILSDANASATFAIDFSLCNSTLHNAGFDCTASLSDNDVLTYDQSDNLWVPRPLNGLSYQGVWNATTAMPAATLNGQYWIVSVANGPYQVGDWIIWKSSTLTFNHITYSTVVVSGVSTAFGRSGAVVALEGDYSLDKMSDVNVSAVAPLNGQVLKFNGTIWTAADESFGDPGSVTTAELADGSVTNAKIASVASTKITGTISSSQITDGTIVNADISSSAAIDYSKLNIPPGSIPYAFLNIANGDIPASKISGLAAGGFTTLTGDVTATGTGSVAATVAQVGGVTAANVAAGANLANAATNSNTINTIVKRDASGNFTAGTITATLNGTATNVTGVVAVPNGGTGKSTLGLNNLLFGNSTSAIGEVASTATPSVLLSADTTGLPTWTTSTAGNFLKGSVTGVTFGPLTPGDLPGGMLSGSGTVNYVPYYTAATTLGNSPIAISGSSVGIGITNPSYALEVNGGPGFYATKISGSNTNTKLGIENTLAAANGQTAEIEFRLGGNDRGKIAVETANAGSSLYDITFSTKTSGFSLERMRILNDGRVGIGTPSPGSALDVKGTLRLSGSTSGYVGFAPAAAAGSTTYTLPIADGSAGQLLQTNGAGILSWVTDSTGAGGFTALTGDVTASGAGSVAATVAQVGGVTAANVATGVNLANAATNLNTASTIIKRDASGNFTAGTITANLSGNATNVTGVVAVANGGTGKSTLGLNNLLFGNTTSAIGEVASTTTPSVLLSANATGLPTWTTSTTGNVLKGSVTGVVFGPLAQSDLPTASLSGSGVANYVPYYTAASTLAISPMTVSGSNVAVGATSPTTTLDINGALTIRGMAAPAVSPAFQGRIYYDSATNKYRVSQNGGAYVDLVSGAGSSDIDGLTDGVANSTNGQLFLGTNAGAANSGLSNTGVGQKVMQANTSGFQNSAFGNEALSKNTTGGTNAAFGMYAMKENTTGSDNTSFGEQTLNSNQGGSENTAIGRQALYGFGGLSTHGKNTALGYRAGVWISTGNNNTFLGHTAGDNVTTGSSNIVIGYNVDAPSATASNQMTIGNIIFATGVNGTGTTVSTGSVGIGIAAPGEKLSVAGTVQSTVGGFKFPDGSIQSAAYTTRLTDISAGIVSTCPMAFNNGVVYSAPTNWTCTIDLNGLSNATNGSSGQFATQLRWGYAYNYPTTFAIEQSSDSSTWTTISASNNTGIQLLSSSVLRYVRLRSIDANGFSNLAGVQIMGGPTGINWASDAPAYVLKETWRTVNGNILIGPGKVGIGTTSPAVALDVVGDIQYTGIITDVSDRRLKKNLSPLEGGLEIIRKIKTYSYMMKDDPKERVEYGVIAQDLQKIDPNLVRIADANKGFLGVNYMGLIPYAINAIQDVDNETKNLRVENEKLKLQLKNVEDLQRVQNQKLERLLKRMGIKSNEI